MIPELSDEPPVHAPVRRGAPPPAYLIPSGQALVRLQTCGCLYCSDCRGCSRSLWRRGAQALGKLYDEGSSDLLSMIPYMPAFGKGKLEAKPLNWKVVACLTHFTG